MIQLLPPSQPLGGSLKQSLSFTLLFLAFFYSIFQNKNSRLSNQLLQISSFDC